MRHRIALLLVGSLSSRALRAWPAAPCCGATVAGTGPALQAGGWEDFQARPGGSTPLGPFAPHGLSRCRADVELAQARANIVRLRLRGSCSGRGT